MSYKKEKMKKSKINQLKFVFGLAFNKFFNKITAKQRKSRKMHQVEKVMTELRGRARLVRPNNLKINDSVDQYLKDCMVKGCPVNILTQWCISSILKKRIKEQGGQFAPTKKEVRILQEEIPAILDLFSKNGFRVNWWITFNPTFVDPDGVPREEYKSMILKCAENLLGREDMTFADWEEDVLDGKAQPDSLVISNFFQYVPQTSLDHQVEQLKTWGQKEAGWNKTKAELEQDAKYAMACEIAEAKLLTFENPIFEKEDWVLIPLDGSEAYDSFTIPVGDFKKRIVPVLPLWPWRMQ